MIGGGYLAALLESSTKLVLGLMILQNGRQVRIVMIFGAGDLYGSIYVLCIGSTISFEFPRNGRSCSEMPVPRLEILPSLLFASQSVYVRSLSYIMVKSH